MFNIYSCLAPIYDHLASLWSFGHVAKSKYAFLPITSTTPLYIMCLGAGTGKELQHIPSCHYILAIEPATGMQRALLRNCPSIAIADTKPLPKQQFNIVIAHYYLNLFDTDQRTQELSHIADSLASEGYLHIADFMPGKWYQSMYTAPIWLIGRLLKMTRSKQNDDDLCLIRKSKLPFKVTSVKYHKPLGLPIGYRSVTLQKINP